MEELDFLKQHWKKEDNFPKIDKDEIRTMLHKNSSSIVKWILIICLFEFLLGLSLKAYYFFIENEEMKTYDMTLEIISTIATGYILIIFLKEYKKIKTFVNTKSLMKSILKTRAWVKIYIIITLSIIAIQWIWGFVDNTYFKAFKKEYIKGANDVESSTLTSLSDTTIAVSLFIAFTIISLFLFLYYRLVYIRLIQKLKHNYDDLINLEE